MDLRFSGVETTVAQVDGGCVGNGCEAQEQSEGTGAETAGSAADEVSNCEEVSKRMSSVRQASYWGKQQVTRPDAENEGEMGREGGLYFGGRSG